MPTLRVWILTDDSAQEKWKEFTRKLEEKISLQIADGYGRLGFSFSYGTLALLIKERLQKYSSQPAHHRVLLRGNLRMMFNEVETTA